MTREERIKYLNQLIIPNLLDNSLESCELRIKQETALRETIDELKQQPCEDCVSRQAVIDAIGNVPDHDDGMVFEALSHAQRDVALLPPVTPQIKIENAPLSMIKSIREKEDNDGHN